MDIFGNKICQTEGFSAPAFDPTIENVIESSTDPKIPNVIKLFTKEFNGIFKVTKRYIGFKGRRLANVNDPIDTKVNKHYFDKELVSAEANFNQQPSNVVTKPEYISILTEFNNYVTTTQFNDKINQIHRDNYKNIFTKKEVENVFMDYFSKTDLTAYLNELSNLKDKVYHKQITEFTFMTGGE